jgi:hypothetical protein
MTRHRDIEILIPTWVRSLPDLLLRSQVEEVFVAAALAKDGGVPAADIQRAMSRMPERTKLRVAEASPRLLRTVLNIDFELAALRGAVPTRPRSTPWSKRQ